MNKLPITDRKLKWCLDQELVVLSSDLTTGVGLIANGAGAFDVIE